MDLGNIGEKSKSPIITCYDTLYKVRNTLFKILNRCNKTKQNGGGKEKWWMWNFGWWSSQVKGDGKMEWNLRLRWRLLQLPILCFKWWVYTCLLCKKSAIDLCWSMLWITGMINPGLRHRKEFSYQSYNDLKIVIENSIDDKAISNITVEAEKRRLLQRLKWKLKGKFLPSLQVRQFKAFST